MYNNTNNKQTKTDNTDNTEENDNYHISKRIEICKLAKSLNMPFYCFTIIVMIFYLYISITSNALLMGNSLDRLIKKEFMSKNTIKENKMYLNYLDSNSNNNDKNTIYNNNKFIFNNNYIDNINYSSTVFKNKKDQSLSYVYYIVIITYYAFILLISQKNIEDLKKLSFIVMTARIIVILLLFASMILTIVKYGVRSFPDSPKFNFSNSALMLGNTLFYFMIQHSIPGIVEGFKPQKNLIKLLFYSFICSFMLFYIYGLFSFISFGHYKTCDFDVFPSAINAYFNLNFLYLNIIGDIINYYPLFNIITGSIQMITLRNNFVIVISSFYPDFNMTYNQFRKVT